MQNASTNCDLSLLSLADLRVRIEKSNSEDFERIKLQLAGDARVGVRKLIAAHERRLEKCNQELMHTQMLYEEQERIAPLELSLGLDEVGRGPVAGPLTVAGVVLSSKPYIVGINDSKKLSAKAREDLACQIKEQARAWTIVNIPASTIDEQGMAQSLRQAFAAVVARIEEKLHLDTKEPLAHILLDGRPLHLDGRELALVGGDARIAAIAAASIIAKDHRDKLMLEYAQEYPQYKFDLHKGYGTQEHIRLIQEHGLSAIHRKSFCSNFLPV